MSDARPDTAGTGHQRLKPVDAQDALISAAKKPRTNKPSWRVRGKQGALSAFACMPLDVLADICDQLDHQTIYYLSLTSKVLRATLLAPTAQPIWVRARKALELPDLAAKELSESQYAHLIWARNCQVCGKGKIVKANFYLRIRVCPSCEKSHLLSRRANNYGRTAEFLSISKMTDHCVSSITRPAKGGKRTIYFVTHLQQFDKRVPDDLRDWEGESWPQRDESTAAARSFMSSFRAKLGSRVQDGRRLQAWHEKQKSFKVQDRNIFKATRLDEIKGRLLAEDEFAKDKLVTEGKPITDLVWVKLLPRLNAYKVERRIKDDAEDLRDRQTARRREFATFYKGIISKHSTAPPELSRYPLPPLHVALALPGWKALWEPDLVPPRQSDIPLEEALVDELLKFRRGIEKQLYDVVVRMHAGTARPIPAPAEDSNPTFAELDAAFARPSALFSCKLAPDYNCHEYFSYSSILEHLDHHSGADIERIEYGFRGKGDNLAFEAKDWAAEGCDIEAPEWIPKLYDAMTKHPDLDATGEETFTCAVGRYCGDANGVPYKDLITHIQEAHLNEADGPAPRTPRASLERILECSKQHTARDGCSMWNGLAIPTTFGRKNLFKVA